MSVIECRVAKEVLVCVCVFKCTWEEDGVCVRALVALAPALLFQFSHLCLELFVLLLQLQCV